MVPYLLDQTDMLWRAAEVLGEVRNAQCLLLAGVYPALVLHGSWDPVEEDPEGLPHGLLAYWTHTRTQSAQHLLPAY